MENAGIPQEPPQGGDNGPTEQPDKQLRAPGERPTAAVRFASRVDEIAPPTTTITSADSDEEDEEDNGSAAPQRPDVKLEDITALSKTLEQDFAEQRMQNFSYVPFSLPASRVASNDESTNATPQQSNSPMRRSMSPRLDMVSPPLTPSGTSGPEASSRALKPGNAQSDGGFDSRAITPQASGQESRPASPRIALPHRPVSAENVSRKSTAADSQDGNHSHRKGMFQLGGSVPASRESSPSRLSASHFYSRPLTPSGDANDPYAANKRPNRHSGTPTDQRFIFKKKKGVSPSSSSTNLAKMGKTDKPDKRHSGFLNVLTRSTQDLQHTGTESSAHSRQSSMSDLKRFFKGPGHKMKKSSSPVSPAPRSSTSMGRSVPFADDHGLSSKYGKIGKVLGSGAGGSVKLMKRSEDNTVFAVKEFRARHTYETEKDYVKKLTAEFCVGSTLQHGNIIETLDIVQEKGKWYEVMEYAPYDLFAIVMTGKMSKAEVTCCFLQILSGVTYLHSLGLAHRDLKLDNVVVSEHGIMKIIDFGSAHVFKYPFENGLNLATGIVGSDPYLAPEVYDNRKYDPRLVDIWSLAIIFCCMSLRRFPWKVPRLTDNSYKLFASEPTPGHDPKKLILPSRPSNDSPDSHKTVTSPVEEKSQAQPKAEQPEAPAAASAAPAATPGAQEATPGAQQATPGAQQATPGAQQADKDAPPVKEVIRGPWRLLRLLPRESRHIIGRMLTIDPAKRAQMTEILAEPWVANTVICRQIGPGSVDRADDHTHVLEPPAAPK